MKKIENINLTLKQIINLLFIALLIVFIAQNAESVKVRYIFWEFNLPLIVIIAISFFVGVFTSKVFSKKKHNKPQITEKQTY